MSTPAELKVKWRNAYNTKIAGADNESNTLPPQRSSYKQKLEEWAKRQKKNLDEAAQSWRRGKIYGYVKGTDSRAEVLRNELDTIGMRYGADWTWAPEYAREASFYSEIDELLSDGGAEERGEMKGSDGRETVEGQVVKTEQGKRETREAKKGDMDTRKAAKAIETVKVEEGKAVEVKSKKREALTEAMGTKGQVQKRVELGQMVATGPRPKTKKGDEVTGPVEAKRAPRFISAPAVEAMEESSEEETDGGRERAGDPDMVTSRHEESEERVVRFLPPCERCAKGGNLKCVCIEGKPCKRCKIWHKGCTLTKRKRASRAKAEERSVCEIGKACRKARSEDE